MAFQKGPHQNNGGRTLETDKSALYFVEPSAQNWVLALTRQGVVCLTFPGVVTEFYIM